MGIKMKKILIFIFTLIVLAGFSTAVISGLPILYGHALFGTESADGCIIFAYLMENDSVSQNDTVGVSGRYGQPNYWKINVNNFGIPLEEGDIIVVNSSCNGNETTRYFTIVDTKGGAAFNLSLNYDPAYQDYDNDGYMATEDCDDNDNTVYPGAPELADGKDNDCDGTIDEGIGAPAGGGGGGGGGGGRRITVTCIPDWQCTDWSSCQPNGKSTRTCTEDLNDCGGEKPSEERNCFYYIPPEAEEEKPEILTPPPNVAPTEEKPLEPTPGILAITGAAVGTAYQQRPLTMGLLTAFILLIVILFVYTHIKDLRHWPFHFKSENKKWPIATLIILIALILLFIYFVLLS